jgi:glucan 1,3-beta-glucosidase
VDQSLGIVDEFTLTQKLPAQAPDILRRHWDQWVNYNDFQKIASSGINLVRIPIGYWAYDNSNSPYVKGASDYMDAAIDWARGTHPPLKIMIDLHGAPGSQNGFDNSGSKTANPAWLTDGGAFGGSAQQTLAVLKTIAQKYAQPQYHDVVVGIELLNEPTGWRLNNGDLRQFFREGYGRIREVSDTTVIIQDSFLAPASYNGFLTPQDNDAQNVALGMSLKSEMLQENANLTTDHHYYQVFSDSEVAMKPWQHRQAVCNNVSSYRGADKWTFVGEWTGAMTDCAPYLNGYNVGARYDGTYPGSSSHGSCAGKSDIRTWSQEFKDDTRGYIEAQIEAFEATTQGWVFWNFKTEGAHEWDLFALLDNGVFPNPITQRKFGMICSNFN